MCFSFLLLLHPIFSLSVSSIAFFFSVSRVYLLSVPSEITLVQWFSSRVVVSRGIWRYLRHNIFGHLYLLLISDGQNQMLQVHLRMAGKPSKYRMIQFQLITVHVENTSSSPGQHLLIPKLTLALGTAVGPSLALQVKPAPVLLPTSPPWLGQSILSLIRVGKALQGLLWWLLQPQSCCCQLALFSSCALSSSLAALVFLLMTFPHIFVPGM